MNRPPLPPFTLETAPQKVSVAEDACNTRDPACVALTYIIDSRWRIRTEFLQGRQAIETFLMRKWQREFDYRLIKEIWGEIASPFALTMSGTTTAETGSVATAMRTENSTSTD